MYIRKEPNRYLYKFTLFLVVWYQIHFTNCTYFQFMISSSIWVCLAHFPLPNLISASCFDKKEMNDPSKLSTWGKYVSDLLFAYFLLYLKIFILWLWGSRQEKYREIPFLIILCKPLTDLLFSNINGLFLVLNNMKHRFWSLKSNKSNLTKGKSINKTSIHKTRITWLVNTWVLMVDNFAKLSSLC